MRAALRTSWLGCTSPKAFGLEATFPLDLALPRAMAWSTLPSEAGEDTTAVEGLARRACKWCRRRGNTPNPLIYERGRFPYLRWRRSAGRECSSCPWVVADLTEQEKAELLSGELADSPLSTPI